MNKTERAEMWDGFFAVVSLLLAASIVVEVIYLGLILFGSADA